MDTRFYYVEHVEWMTIWATFMSIKSYNKDDHLEWMTIWVYYYVYKDDHLEWMTI